MIPYFDIPSDIQEAMKKNSGITATYRPSGVAAQFAWQLFVKGLLRGNVIDGGWRPGDLANAIAEKREVQAAEEEEMEEEREYGKRGFNKDTESVGA